MYNFSGIKEILENQGYNILDCGGYLKTSAVFRFGDNPGAITIYPEVILDHVTGNKYSYKDFLCLVLGLENKDKIDEILEKSGAIVVNNEIQEPIIKTTKTLNKDFINKLDKSDKSQEYWINRGISLEVLKELGGGMYKNKYYFPIYNSKSELIGWQYRNLDKDCEKRYSIRGEKKNFVYPAFVCSKDIIKSKKVYLHEGIPDAVSAMTIGIRNNLVLFGTELNFSIINYLLKIPDIQIVICQNNDDAGRISSGKIRKKLIKYFDWSQVRVKEVYDPYKDLNDMIQDSPEILKKWFDK